YAYSAATLYDSSSSTTGIHNFLVSAHISDNPGVFYDSDVGSGYSVDNLAPAAPSGLSASITEEDFIQLTWDSPVDADFDYFALYRSVESGFDPSGTEPYKVTIDTNFVDTVVVKGLMYYYRLSAFDFSKNESEFSQEVSAVLAVAGGDIDSNGTVQAFDASLVLRFLTGTLDFTLWQEFEADVSDNDEVTEMDASLILQHVVGAIDLFPSESGPPPPLAAGELSVPGTVEASGNEVVLPILLMDGDKVFSGSFDVLYDTGALELTEVRTTLATEGFLTAHQTIDGEAELFLVGSAGVAGDHSIMELVFRRIPGGSSRTEIVLASARLNDNIIWTLGDTTVVDFITGVDDERAGLPTEFALSQNHPNPFNPETTIRYALPEASGVSLIIYNLRGEEVARLVDGEQPAGHHQVTWNASNIASGMYFYRLQAGEFVQTKKMVLLK
ncbi:MAG: T9SS type A sorting domain-containing protein, partial [Candidatus Marinimicrobia bacterium]|nr:T9SS type A sorting domain-containing protein [Candidatus Neomarinimicrobiota bacterium]